MLRPRRALLCLTQKFFRFSRASRHTIPACRPQGPTWRRDHLAVGHSERCGTGNARFIVSPSLCRPQGPTWRWGIVRACGTGNARSIVSPSLCRPQGPTWRWGHLAVGHSERCGTGNARFTVSPSLCRPQGPTLRWGIVCAYGAGKARSIAGFVTPPSAGTHLAVGHSERCGTGNACFTVSPSLCRPPGLRTLTFFAGGVIIRVWTTAKR